MFCVIILWDRYGCWLEEVGGKVELHENLYGAESGIFAEALVMLICVACSNTAMSGRIGVLIQGGIVSC